ncbi:hypothetical protein LTR10_003583 [Elasticomyces elasticus]|nr:hypothetical protein LTR10_003583 [Elasticomyces elasticus]
MNASANAPTIYPKRYFSASPTFNAWNKVTSKITHHDLHTERGFEGQNLYFYHNHPIHYVRIVGILVDIVTRGKNGEYTILTIDDSSGECIDVKITTLATVAGNEKGYASNTGVENVDVHVTMGLPTLHLNFKPVQIGEVLEIKGTISVFRRERQIELKRLFLVPGTNAEASEWRKTALWISTVLSRPWVLTDKERDAMDKRIKREEVDEKKMSNRRRAKDAKHDEERKRYEEKREAKRKRAESRMNEGALKGSSILPTPWD